MKLPLLPVLTFLSSLGVIAASGATVAYWRFETGPANTPVLHAGAAGVFEGTVPDVSGNGNHLSAWTQAGCCGFAYRSDVPFVELPQNGVTNRFSVKNTGGFPAMFTAASGGSPSGINAATMTPAQFTIEVSYKPENSGGYRTVVGRDAQNVATGNGGLAALYLQIRPDDSVRIQFVDVSGFTHQAYSPPGWIYGFNFSSNPEGTNASWYHLAAVSDGATLKLYVNNVQVASTDLTASGSPDTALARGTTSGSDWSTGAWSVGRGLYASGHTDRAYGLIDEVRISNSALTPNEFLAAPRPRISSVVAAGNNLVFNVAKGQPGATCRVLESTNATVPVTTWTEVTNRVFDANGNTVFALPGDPANNLRLYRLKADLLVPGPGALSYSLAGGNGGWPANIRDQIIYAMEGAVAQYNRWGTFNKHVTANYNPGVPTAQASYSGWIDFGGQIGYRTALHEISHTLGVGTHSSWNSFLSNGIWTGANGVQQVQAFDGPGAVINSDGTHFWPYGLNYDNEASTENNRRHVIMVGAFRKDLGVQ